MYYFIYLHLQEQWLENQYLKVLDDYNTVIYVYPSVVFDTLWNSTTRAHNYYK